MSSNRAVRVGRREVAACVACGHVLGRYHSLSVDQLLALTVAAALLFLIANAYPLMVIEVGGMHTEAAVWGATLLMLRGWTASPAVVLALTMFVHPLLQMVAQHSIGGAASSCSSSGAPPFSSNTR